MNITLRRFLRQKEARSQDYALLLFRMTSRVRYFIVHSTIGSTVHFRPLNSLEHCICTTTTTNIRPDWDSYLVPPGYKPQSIRVSHRGRSLILKREKLKTGPLYSLVTKNQASVWNIEEDMITFVMILWRPFWFFMIHVVMSLEVSCVYRIPWYRKHVVWWNKLVSTSIIDEYMLTSVISWRLFWTLHDNDVE